MQPSPRGVFGTARRTGAAMLGAMLIAASTSALAATAHLPPVIDLAAQASAAASRGEPLVVLVTLPGCVYCETVRRNYLGPQAAAGEIEARSVVVGATPDLAALKARGDTAASKLAQRTFLNCLLGKRSGF